MKNQGGVVSEARENASYGNLQGMLFCGLAVCLDVGAYVIFKYVSGLLSIGSFIFLRSIVSLILLTALYFKRIHLTNSDVRELPDLMIKSVSGAFSIAMVIYCISHESFGDVVAIIHTGPIFAVVIGYLLWGNTINKNQLVALILCGAGCLAYITSSVKSGMITPALLMITAAFFYGVSLAYTSRIKNTSKIFIVLAYAGICGFLSLPFVEWQEIWTLSNNPWLMLLLLGSASINISMNTLMIKAYRLAHIANLAAIDYLGIPLGFLVAYLLWGEIPGLLQYLIVGFIVSGGIALIWHEKKAKR